MERKSSFIWDAKTVKAWEAASDEVRLSTLIHYMQEYNVDKTYDNYILLTLAAHGFLKIEYDCQVDETVLRHMEKVDIWLREEGDRVAKDRLGNSIGIVHTVPDNHPLLPLVECAKSHYVNNHTHSYEEYASMFEADFMLSYLMLLIGEKKLRENYRKIFLDIYQPKSDGALWKIPEKDFIELNESYFSQLHDGVFSAPVTIKKNYGAWETFVVNFLDIKQGSVLDFYAGVGTLAMHLNLDDVAYTANMPQLKEHDLMNMFFCTDAYFSDFLKKKQIQLYNEGVKGLEIIGLKGTSFDFIIANFYNQVREKYQNDFDALNLLNSIDILLSSKGKALVTLHNRNFRNCRSYTHLVDSIILLEEKRSIVLLNKNKEHADLVKVYDRTEWEDFTAKQLLDSIRGQENMQILTQEDIHAMGGYFEITVFKRQQYKIEVHAGEKLIKLSEILTLQNGYRLRGDIKDVRYLLSDIKEYTPLSPYVTAENGIYISKSDVKKREYRLVNQKCLVVLAFESKFRTFIFDPRDGEAGFPVFSCPFIVDEEKVNIDYLVCEMNKEYFLKQLFPSGREFLGYFRAKAEDILSCQILVPDVKSSVERQKQIVEDLRQKEIAEFVQRYGFDLGKFVQYEASDLPKETTLCKGKYTILKNIGHGGFGKVYQARDEETKEVVAIKEFFHNELQVRDPKTNQVKAKFSNIDAINFAKDKFRHEIEKIKKCEHENIIKVYEEFEENNTCYYSMEFIEGQSLEKYCGDTKCFGEEEAIVIIRQVAEALKAMHVKGYNHSDVKPKNILVDNGKAILIDFGGTHYYGDDDEKGMSVACNTALMKIESPGYTPEWAYATQKFHAGRDIYSLGATLYFVLTKRAPTTMNREQRPDEISPKTWNAICKAMAKSPKRSLTCMDDFLALLPGDDEIKMNDCEEHDDDETRRKTPSHIESLKENEVFVFGSNIDGLHAGGASRQAVKWGAKWGVSVGCVGNTYAIPTVDVQDFDVIEAYVEQFIEYAGAYEHKTFFVTEIGCGNAGFTPEQIAPLFKDCVDMSNVYLPESFWQVLRRNGLTE